MDESYLHLMPSMFPQVDPSKPLSTHGDDDCESFFPMQKEFNVPQRERAFSWDVTFEEGINADAIHQQLLPLSNFGPPQNMSKGNVMQESKQNGAKRSTFNGVKKRETEIKSIHKPMVCSEFGYAVPAQINSYSGVQYRKRDMPNQYMMHDYNETLSRGSNEISMHEFVDSSEYISPFLEGYDTGSNLENHATSGLSMECGGMDTYLLAPPPYPQSLITSDLIFPLSSSDYGMNHIGDPSVMPMGSSMQQHHATGVLKNGHNMFDPIMKHVPKMYGDNVQMQSMQTMQTMQTMQAMPSPAYQMVPSTEIRIGAYTREERQMRIDRFRAKKQKRIWKKQIKYDCRKRLADTRPRVKGRFVSRSEREAMGRRGSEGGGDGDGDDDLDLGDLGDGPDLELEPHELSSGTYAAASSSSSSAFDSESHLDSVLLEVGQMIGLMGPDEVRSLDLGSFDPNLSLGGDIIMDDLGTIRDAQDVGVHFK